MSPLLWFNIPSLSLLYTYTHMCTHARIRTHTHTHTHTHVSPFLVHQQQLQHSMQHQGHHLQQQRHTQNINNMDTCSNHQINGNMQVLYMFILDVVYAYFYLSSSVFTSHYPPIERSLEMPNVQVSYTMQITIAQLCFNI